MDFRSVWSFLQAFVMAFYIPFQQNANNVDEILNLLDDVDDLDEFDLGAIPAMIDDLNNLEVHDNVELEPDLKWSFAVNGVLEAGFSEFQARTFLDTKPFGKALIIDGKMQSAEKDEFAFHENLVHPALLIHDEPRAVFIMGGGEGSSAREVLKNKDIEKVIMCDIDQEVVECCREYLTENQEAFNDQRLQIVYNDAKDELEKHEEKFDVIVGDLCNPIEGGPCNHLYTKSFYEQGIKPKLKDKGIFVTQAGPAGVLSHKQVFSPIYNTLKQAFNHVIAYTAHVPSFADTCGWVMASDQPFELDAEKLNIRIQERIKGELRFLDGPLILASTILNKTLFISLMIETQVITEENMKVVHGYGIHNNA